MVNFFWPHTKLLVEKNQWGSQQRRPYWFESKRAITHRI